MSTVFKVDTSKLPAYLGVADSKKGYLLIKVTGVHNTLAEDEEAKKAAIANLRTALAAEYGAAYLGTLKADKNVSVNTRLLMTDNAAQQ